MSTSIWDLDDKEQIISSALWRNVCGSPSGNSWKKYRQSIGLNPDNRKHQLTRKEAYLLLVRTNMKEICEKLQIKKPRDVELEAYTPDSPLLAIADLYAQALAPDKLNSILANAIQYSALDGDAVLKLLKTLGAVANRKVGEGWVRAVLMKGGIENVRKKEKYSHAQVKTMIALVLKAIELNS